MSMVEVPVVTEDLISKRVRSKDYNYVFDKRTGFFARWGETPQDDPDFSPFGPEILDIEITTICHGVPDEKYDINNPTGIGLENYKSPCRFCYKANTPCGKNMSLEVFIKVVDEIKASNDLLCQMALGCDAEGTANPDMFKMMEYARSVGVIPNLTVANITEETAQKIASLAGACAVSRYANKNVCYDTIQRLSKAGLKQINMHVLAAEETFDWITETLNDRLVDPRLKNVKAIVLLSLKKQGRGKSFNGLFNDKFKKIVDFAFQNNIGLGFDSCGCHLLLDAIKDHPQFEQIKMSAEPCEASCFSSYSSVDGKYLPCSFCSGLGIWGDGLDILECDNFTQDIWQHKKTKEFRKVLLNSGRHCPYFQIGKS